MRSCCYEKTGQAAKTRRREGKWKGREGRQRKAKGGKGQGQGWGGSTWPDAITLGELFASFDVRTDTLVAPAVTAPMVKPLTVTVTAVLTAITDDPVSVKTMALAEGVAADAVLPELRAAVGLPDGAKKPDG